MKFKKIFSMSMAFLMLSQSFQFVYANETNKITAFIGAEGGGMYTEGARRAENREIYHVTTLDDSGEGSFRDAVSADNRVIVFDIDGTITLDSKLYIESSNITILGQTAPGEGICIRGNSVVVQNCENVIIRYIRIRPGDIGTDTEDALWVHNTKDVIVDHCSFSWCEDECLSAYANRNFTAQYCIISESLNNSKHEKGEHGYGGIWGGENASFHHNLLSSHKSRLPRIGTSFTVHSYNDNPDTDSLVDIRNNVIYNWVSNSAYGGENGIRVNIVNNYYQPTVNTKRKIFYQVYGGNDNLGTTLYINGNFMETGGNISTDNKNGVEAAYSHYSYNLLDNISDGIEVEGILKRNDEFIYDYPVTTAEPFDAWHDVIENAGASFRRDITDKRIISDVVNRTYPNGSRGSVGLIDSQDDVGGWCYLKKAVKPQDTDNDGLPDTYEDENGLDKNNSADSVQIAANGYMNIENYAESVLQFKDESTLDMTKLNSALAKGMSIDRTLYYESDMTKLAEMLQNAENVYNNSNEQALIDSTANELSEFIESLVPVYRPFLEKYVEEKENEDKYTYTVATYNAFIAELTKSKEDLAKYEDNNELFKQDYENLVESFEKLEFSKANELFDGISKADEYIAKGNLYVETSVNDLKIKREEAQKLLDSYDYTEEQLSEKITELNQYIRALKEIDYAVLDEYSRVLKTGILGYEYLDDESKAVVAELQNECNSLKERSYKDNTEIYAFKDKIMETVRTLTHKKDFIKEVENHELSDDISDILLGGKYEIIEKDGEKYMKTAPYSYEDGYREGIKLSMPLDKLSSETYFSTDFYVEYDKSLVISQYRQLLQSFIFGDDCQVSIVACDETSGHIQIYYAYSQYRNGEKYGTDRDFFDSSLGFGKLNADNKNNLTTRYSDKKLYIYLNNLLVYTLDVSKNTENSDLTFYGIAEGVDISNLNNLHHSATRTYLKNMNLFKFSRNISDTSKLTGDADNDGKLTASDAAYLFIKSKDSSFELPIEKEHEDIIEYLDVNGDGKITRADALEILKKARNDDHEFSALS